MAAVAVEVVCALPDRVAQARVEVPAGATLREAIERSGVLGRCPEIDLARWRVGVFGRLRSLEDAVAAGDRVEVYRPLQADPKELRRCRARRARAPRSG